MTERQEIQAERTYAKQFEQASTTVNAFNRIAAQEVLRNARRVLTPQEQAIMDMVAGRGRLLKDVAAKTGRSVEDLKALYLGARVKLAAHYEQNKDAA